MGEQDAFLYTLVRTPPKKQLYLQRPEELEEHNSPAATGSLPGLPAAAPGSGTLMGAAGSCQQ